MKRLSCPCCNIKECVIIWATKRPERGHYESDSMAVKIGAGDDNPAADSCCVAGKMVCGISASLFGMVFLSAGQCAIGNGDAFVPDAAITGDGNPNVYVSKFSMGILQIFNPNSKKAQYEFSSTLVISAECSCAIQCNADYFKEMYEKQVPEDKADEVYPLLFSTMRIDDIFVRYLMQYEILLGQVTNEHTQKEVTDYIKKVYNPANKDRQIGFQLTRRPRRKYKEDDLTYNRNLLGHGDIEKAVSEEKIRQLSRSIMDVLWFSLWNKAE